MRSIKSACTAALLSLLFSGVLAHAVPVSGTVTDKTTNKPSAGDKVELVDVQQGMAVVASTTTDAKGHYKLEKTGAGPELVRVTHQGGQYFIAAPEGGEPGDIPVYDVAATVEGMRIEADVIEVDDTSNGQLQMTEQIFVHNTATPPHTQYNPSKGFEVIIPADAMVDGASAKRPTGMPTVVQVKPGNGAGHFVFDFPIQPDEADKDTLFRLSYHMPYSGTYTFHPRIPLPADNVAVLLPKSISFKAESGSTYQAVPQDPAIQTLLSRNVGPGTALDFTVSGQGTMPREQQGPQGQGQQAQVPSGPGGGIGEPINTPDPLSKYKFWILGGVLLLLAAVAGFLLRKPSAVATAGGPPVPAPDITRPVARAPRPQASQATASPAFAPAHPPAPVAYTDHNATLLHVLKEEMFAIESEKLSGQLSPAAYAEQKGALEIVLKRALQKKA